MIDLFDSPTAQAKEEGLLKIVARYHHRTKPLALEIVEDVE